MTEHILLKHLTNNTEYFSNVFNILESSDFEDRYDSKIFKTIGHLYTKYNKCPNLSELELYFDSAGIDIQEKSLLKTRINDIQNTSNEITEELILDSTEKWLKLSRFRRDVVLAGADVVDGTNTKNSLESLQKTSEEINKISFKTSVGLDYKKDAIKNFEQYQEVDSGGIKMNINLVDVATGNGMKPGTLTIYSAVSNSGKTTMLTNNAGASVLQGKNVAYFTFEESELEIRERIDALLLDKKTSELVELGSALKTPFDFLLQQNIGNIKIKAYAPRSANALTIKAQIEEWKLKDGFIPDIIIADSITIISPVNKSDNLYGTGKAVSEEVKGLGVDFNVPVISAVQLGRQAYGATSVGMESVGESIAIMQVATTVIGVVLDDKRPDIRLLSILKSRKINKAKTKSEIVNIDTDRQKIWDLSDGDKRAYIKQDMKDDMQGLQDIVDVAQKVETSGTNVLDALLNK